MNRRKENKFSAYLAILKWYELNQTAADALPKVAILMASIKNNVLNIDQINQLLQADPTGVAKLKAETRDKLEIAAMDVVVKLVAWFASEGNTQAEEEINFGLRDLRNAADTVLKDRCSLVIEIGNAQVAAMPAEFKLTPEMLSALFDLNKTYFDLIPMPRLKTAERKVKKEEMDVLFRAVDKDLAMLTKMISIVRFSDVTFYNSYMGAKMIVDYKGKQKSPEVKTGTEGVITDFETEQPIKNVKITANTTDVVVMSDDEGYYKLPLPAGTNKVTYEAEGYTTYTEEIEVEEGILFDNDIELEKPEPQPD
jgi:hypothetical protein